MVIYEYDYPDGISMDNVKFRSFVWIVSEILLVCAVALNFLPSELVPYFRIHGLMNSMQHAGTPEFSKSLSVS